MALFSPDVVMFGDPEGFGQWLAGHWFEHQQFITLGLQFSPSRQFLAYDIYSWRYEPESIRAWLDAHQQMHDSLRRFTGVGGIDLSEIDFQSPDDFQAWMAYHQLEHQQLRAAFGVS